MSNSSHRQPPHLAVIPSTGMGHLNPFCCLAVLLSDRGCTVFMNTAWLTVSLAESVRISQLLDLFPSIHSLEVPLVELPLPEFPSVDTFLLRFEALRRSAHLLPPLLVAVSAFVVDISLASTFVQSRIVSTSYILSISSAAMLSLCPYFLAYIAARTTVADIDIAGLWTIFLLFMTLTTSSPSNSSKTATFRRCSMSGASLATKTQSHALPGSISNRRNP